MVDITVRDEDIAGYGGPALAVAVPAGEAPLNEAARAVDERLDGLLSRLRSSGEIKGKLGETTILHSMGRLAAERVIVVGAGDPAKLSVAGLRRMAANAARAARRAALPSYATTIYRREDLPAAADAQILTEGTLLGLYRFDAYRGAGGDERASEVREVAVLPRALDRAEVEEGVRRGRAVAAGVALARDLINEPPNVLTPAELARRAQAMAAEHGLACEVLDRDRMRALGMNALLGVAEGSDEPPAFIILRHGATGGGAAGPCLVGKGITFDSGGISIKPAENMHRMKGDMGGAAAVIGAMRALAGLGFEGPVTALVPATENLLGGRAMTPGDIVRAMNGVSIEIINTDAEGRLILADALSYAVREGYAPLVDVATLTGAASVALGPVYTAVFSNDEGTAAAVLNAAETAGEKMWRMPLDEAFEERIKSDVADIKNTGGREGGAVTAAMFIQHFVDDKPWAHLDIAPTSWSEKDEGEWTKGGSGVAVRTLVALVEALAPFR